MTVSELAKVLAAIEATGHGTDRVEIVEHEEDGSAYRCEAASLTFGDGFVAIDSLEIPEL